MLPSGLEDQAEFLTHSSKGMAVNDAGGAAYGERSHTCRSETERPCYMRSLEYVSLLSQGPAHPNRAITVFTHTSAWGNRTLAP